MLLSMFFFSGETSKFDILQSPPGRHLQVCILGLQRHKTLARRNGNGGRVIRMHRSLVEDDQLLRQSL